MNKDPFREDPQGVLIRVWVVPRASKPAITGWHDGRLRVRVSAPPEGGRANEEVARILSGRLGAPVELAGGATSRDKVFLVRDLGIVQARKELPQ